MLRGDAVGHRSRLGEGPGHDDLAVGLDGGPGDLLPLQGLELGLNFPGNGLGQFSGVGDQDGGGHLVVLRLAEQVGGHPGGVGISVGNHQHLGGAGDHVDVHQSKHLPLGLGHIGVAGAHDLVHLGHRFRPVGQSGHRLRPAHFEDAGDPGQLGRRQDGGADLPVPSRRGGHNDLPHPGDVGGDGVHQHGGGVGGGAPGHIDAHPGQRGDLLTQDHPLPLGHEKSLPLLLGVEGADVFGGLPEDLGEFPVHLGGPLLQLLGGHLQGGELHPVELLFILQQGRIPPLLHGAEDVRHRGGHVHRLLLAGKNFLLRHLVEVVYLYHGAHLTDFWPGRPAWRGSPGT